VFALELETNVADPEQADKLVFAIAHHIAFFDWLEDPSAVVAEVMRRYVPGFIEPGLIAPFLRAHLGKKAVFAYADALLRGRPELAPAFMTALDDDGNSQIQDHGTQLARAIRLHGDARCPEIPPGTVRSTAARGYRSFFGSASLRHRRHSIPRWSTTSKPLALCWPRPSALTVLRIATRRRRACSSTARGRARSHRAEFG
jgi:hypothetical protein